MSNEEAVRELTAFYGYYAGEIREECNIAISAIEERDYWEREAKKAVAKLGEIQILMKNN